MSTKKHLFVFGLNERNQAQLERVAGAEELVFHPLLQHSDVRERTEYDVEDLLRRCRAILDGADRVDGFIHYIDFPVSTLVPVLAREYGVPAASLEAVLKCEHKYWSRIEQARCVGTHVPPFAAFDPFDHGALERLEREIGYPFWVKPIKSFSSYLGFRIESRDDFHRAMERIRAEIGRFRDSFDVLLGRAHLPPEVAGIGGGHCIAEGLIGGHQCTLEGYVHGGSVEVYGAVDSLRHANESTFGRYQYPSQLPRPVLERMEGIIRSFLTHIGYTEAPFNAEFFWEPGRDQVWLLEVNTRISESHCELFEKVDGVSHHQVAVDLALGRSPRMPRREGPFRVAGKCFVRTYQEGRVRRAPTHEEIEALEREIPGTRIDVLAHPGQELSELMDQDSYTYCLAVVFLGARDQEELLERYREVERRLPFQLDAAAA